MNNTKKVTYGLIITTFVVTTVRSGTANRELAVSNNVLVEIAMV